MKNGEISKRLLVCSFLAATVTVGCGDGAGDKGGNDGGDELPTFEEPLVESAEVEGLAVLHSRPEQEGFYEAGVFAKNHPIAFIVQMAWDDAGYTHPLYVGLVNADRTKACLVGSREISYGGPNADPNDVEARRFVIQEHVPEHCGPEFMGDGPYDVWVGANRYVSANPNVTEDDTEAPKGGEIALLSEGNVLIFGDEITDLSGGGRGDACGEIVAGATSFERTDGPCGAKIEVGESPGSNILVDKMVLESAVGVLTTTTTLMGDTVCVQDKGNPLLQGSVDLALYGQQPADYEGDEASNDLVAPIKVVQRVCLDDGGNMGDTRCDRGDAQWVPLLINPQAPSEAPGWDPNIGNSFPDAPPPPGAVPPDALEAGEFDDSVSEMSYLDLTQKPQQLVLPRMACAEFLQALTDNRPGAVLETCISTMGADQDKAYGGEMDNCIRQGFEIAQRTVNREVDPMGPPPPPGSNPPMPSVAEDGHANALANPDLDGDPSVRSSTHSGGWLSTFNRTGSFSYSYGDSDWTKLKFEAGYAVAGGTDGAYAGAYFESSLDGQYDLDLAGLEIYADAHDSSNSDPSEAVFEATALGVSEGVGSSNDSAFELRVSAWGINYEKCINEKYGWWVASVKVEGCASFTADVGGTLIGEFYLSNTAGNLEAVVGVVDVGPLIDANMDASLQAGDGCCSIKISGELSPLAYLSIGNDFYLIGEVDTNGNLVSLTFTAALGNLELVLVDGYVKLKICFLGKCKSTKLINKDGWSWSSTLYNWSVSL